MPYKSAAQRAKFHELLKQGKISKEVVDEFDQASKGLSLPERVTPFNRQKTRNRKKQAY